MTQEVCAAAEAAFDANYDEVIVADGHGNAHNIEPDLLPENVRLIRSWPRPLVQMQGAEDPEVEACVFLGYHAGTDSPGILSHSYSGAAFRSVRLNGEICSEGYLNAALAGELGKSIIFVSGDQFTIDDARRYAPDAVGFVSKQALGWRTQMSLPPKQVARQLKDAVSRALSAPLPKRFLLNGPYCLELEMTTPVAAEMLTYLPNVERRSSHSISITLNNLTAVMRFVSFAMIYSPNGVLPL